MHYPYNFQLTGKGHTPKEPLFLPEVLSYLSITPIYQHTEKRGA